MATQCVSPIGGGKARCFRMTTRNDGLCFQHGDRPQAKRVMKEYRVVDKNGKLLAGPYDQRGLADEESRSADEQWYYERPTSVEVRDVSPWRKVEGNET